MSTQNVVNGKAFEWAVARHFSIQLGGTGEIGSDLIIDSEAARYAKECFDSLEDGDQSKWSRFADNATAHIIHRERQNAAVVNVSGIAIASDSEGIGGDVRDVVIHSPGGKSLGVSCKNNHDAFKHPRLSGTIDFVKEWGLSSKGCSDTYWIKVSPIFDRLSALRQTSDKKLKFAEVANLRSEVMEPVINAFVDEIVSLANEGTESEALLCSNLVQYVIGNRDFYKVIKDDSDSQIRVMGFNFNGTLTGRRPKLPKSMVGINQQKASVESGNSVTVFIQLDLGYSFKMRLHTASRRVESSLKFDVQAVGLPPRDIYQHFIDIV